MWSEGHLLVLYSLWMIFCLHAVNMEEQLIQTTGLSLSRADEEEARSIAGWESWSLHCRSALKRHLWSSLFCVNSEQSSSSWKLLLQTFKRYSWGLLCCRRPLVSFQALGTVTCPKTKGKICPVKVQVVSSSALLGLCVLASCWSEKFIL